MVRHTPAMKSFVNTIEKLNLVNDEVDKVVQSVPYKPSEPTIDFIQLNKALPISQVPRDGNKDNWPCKICGTTESKRHVGYCRNQKHTDIPQALPWHPDGYLCDLCHRTPTSTPAHGDRLQVIQAAEDITFEICFRPGCANTEETHKGTAAQDSRGNPPGSVEGVERDLSTDCSMCIFMTAQPLAGLIFDRSSILSSVRNTIRREWRPLAARQVAFIRLGLANGILKLDLSSVQTTTEECPQMAFDVTCP